MSKILRIGIVGAGGIARYGHIPAYKKNPACELIALSDISDQARKDASNRYRIPNVYEITPDMLDTEELDAVSICTPPSTHASIIAECAKRNIHILCEKPLALSAMATEKIIHECEKNKVILAVGYTLRFYGNLELIKKWLMQGKLGQLRSIISVYHRPPPRNKWIYNAEVSGGGVIMDLGSHVIDFHNWLVREEIDSLSAYADTSGKKSVENMASLNFKYKKNITGMISLSWLAPQETIEHFVICSKAIAKTNGIMEIKFQDTSELYKSGNKALMRFRSMFRFFPLQKSNPFELEVNDFITSILMQKKPRATGYDDLNVRKIVDSIYELI